MKYDTVYALKNIVMVGLSLLKGYATDFLTEL